MFDVRTVEGVDNALVDDTRPMEPYMQMLPLSIPRTA